MKGIDRRMPWFLMLLSTCLLSDGACVAHGFPAPEIAIESGSTASELRFALTYSADDQIRELYVHECAVLETRAPYPRDQALWAVVAGSTEDTYPETIRYGTAPRGWTTVVEPKPLEEGCYVVIGAGWQQLAFGIDGAGRAEVLGVNGSP